MALKMTKQRACGVVNKGERGEVGKGLREGMERRVFEVEGCQTWW